MLCINMTAVSQHQTGLLGIEWNFFLCLIYMTIIFIHQSCNRFSMKNRLFKNFFAVFQFYFQIQVVIRFNTNQRTHLTESMTSAHLKSHMSDFFTDFDKVKANAMLADLHIGGRDKIGSMSKGTQEKMQLCLTMSRAARLYLLDEPLGGVDPAARDYILSTILHNYSEDAALMLSTHLIGDIEKVLDEVILLQDGKVLRQAAVDELREETGESVDAYFREVYKC